MASTHKLIYSSHRNPCPVCGRTKDGDCRISQDDNLILCHTYSDGADIPGFRYLGSASDPTWGKFVRLDGDDREEGGKPKYQRREEKRESAINTLSPSERDSEYRRIIKKFGYVTTLYRKELQRRGLTIEQIDFAEAQGWIGNWIGGEDIGGNFALAGIHPSTGKSLGCDGLVLAAMNLDGEICGYQIYPKSAIEARLNGEKCKGSKYIWLSSSKADGGSKPNLANGELPIAIRKHPSVALDDITVVLFCEGLLKSAIVALRYWTLGRTDIMVIGVSGCNFGGYSQQIKQILSATPRADRWLTPDAGMFENKAVLKGYNSLSELVSELKVLWWEQSFKNHKDIDELKPELLTRDGFIEYHPWKNSAIKKACDSLGIFPQEIEADIFNSHAVQGKFTPTETVNSEFLDRGLVDARDELVKLWGIRSAMGTGKTATVIKEICENADNQVYILNHRINLGLQTAEKIDNLYHWSGHLSPKARYLMLDNPDLRLSLCLDSICKIPLDNFVDSTIIIDEALAVLNHLWDSSTLSDKRTEVFNHFAKAFKICRNVILFDANLTDRVVKIIAELADIRTEFIKKIENKFTPIPRKTNLLLGRVDEDGLNPDDNSSLISEAISGNGKYVIISDNAKQLEEMNRLCSEDGRNCLEISQRTTAITGDNPQYQLAQEALKLKNEKEWIEFLNHHQIDRLLISPTAESGLSVDAYGCFDNIYGLFYGIIPIDSLIQMLGRLRDRTVPANIWIRDVSIAMKYKYKDCQSEGGIIQADRIEFLSTFDILDSKCDYKALMDAYKTNPLAKYRAEFTMNDIQEKRLYRKLAISRLMGDAGYDVTTYEVNISSDIKEDLKEEREKIDLEKAEAIYKADDIDDVTAKRIDKAEVRNLDDDTRLKRYKINKALPGWKDKESFKPKAIRDVRNDDLIKTANRNYGLHNWENYRRCKVWDFDYQTIEQAESLFIPDLDYSEALEIKAAIDAGIGGLVAITKPLTGESSEVEAVCSAIAKLGDRYLGKQGNMSNIQYLQIVLKRFGYHLRKEEKRIDGEKSRQYYIAPIEVSFWGDLKDATAIRFEEKIKLIERDDRNRSVRESVKAENNTDSDFKPVPPPPINLYKNGLDGGGGTEQGNPGEKPDSNSNVSERSDNTEAEKINEESTLKDELFDLCYLPCKDAAMGVQILLNSVVSREDIYRISLSMSHQGVFIRGLLEDCEKSMAEFALEAS